MELRFKGEEGKFNEDPDKEYYSRRSLVDGRNPGVSESYSRVTGTRSSVYRLLIRLSLVLFICSET